MADEWAIRDEATSEWLTPLGTWSEESAWRTSEYQSVAAMYVTCVPKSRFSARIVPAPPREMSDSECWQWLQSQLVYLCGVESRSDNTWQIQHWNNRAFLGGGDTPCAAIRAARRALEKKL